MAYRFLLEVPEAYEDDANTAVAVSGDAQVLVKRNSHGLGFDDPYVDLTVAAHSLAVIPELYRWANDIGATRPESRATISIVLHNGRRIGLHEVDAPGMVAAIRRDQPWVERSLPKIGEHELNEVTKYRLQQLRARTGAGAALANVDEAGQLPAVQAVVLERAADTFDWDREEYALVQVAEIAKAEQFYFDVLGLNLVGRLKRDERGNWREMVLEPDIRMASYHPGEADRVLLEHGPLRLALARAGHGAPLDYARVTTHFALLVEPDVLARLRATVLVRGYDVLDDDGRNMTFRDPFGVAWSVTDQAAPAA